MKNVSVAVDGRDPEDTAPPRVDQTPSDSSTTSSEDGDLSDWSLKSLSEPEISSELKRILFHVRPPCCQPDEGIIPWIRREYHRSKGFEIGTINPSLLPALYHEQIKNWKYYTLDHINQVLSAIHSFLRQMLRFVCSDHQVCDRLWTVLSPRVVDSYSGALVHVTLLVEVEEAGNIRTLNHYFALTLEKLRLRRVKKRLASVKS